MRWRDSSEKIKGNNKKNKFIVVLESKNRANYFAENGAANNLIPFKEDNYSSLCEFCNHSWNDSTYSNISECQEIEKMCKDPDENDEEFCEELCKQCSSFDFCSLGLAAYIIIIIVISVLIFLVIVISLIIYCCPCCGAVMLFLCCCCKITSAEYQDV
jgi:hypothetical protein